MRWPRWLPIDPYVVAMLATVAFAMTLPARGSAATAASIATKAAVGLLFFLYGARTSPAVARSGASHWRIHVVVLLCTFALFPVLGVVLAPLAPTILTVELYQGVLFLCAVPSTVQSAVALTALARGNVPVAIFSASFSSIAGVLLTPLLVFLLMGRAEGVVLTVDSVVNIVLQLLLPFALGFALRPWVGNWIQGRKRSLGLVDRGSILLVVYTAVSAGVTAGLWRQVTAGHLAAMFVVLVSLLVTVLALIAVVTRTLGFDLPDRVTAIFCGSTKSAATGLPMATVFFGATAGLIVLPLIFYHQIQLVVCTILAQRLASRAGSGV